MHRVNRDGYLTYRQFVTSPRRQLPGTRIGDDSCSGSPAQSPAALRGPRGRIQNGRVLMCRDGSIASGCQFNWLSLGKYEKCVNCTRSRKCYLLLVQLY